MSLDWLAPSVAALVPLVVGAKGFNRGAKKLRANIRFDVETLAKIPSGTSLSEPLLSHVEKQIEQLSVFEAKASRKLSDVLMFGSFGLTCTAGALLLFFLFGNEKMSWWSVLLPSAGGMLLAAACYCFYRTFEAVSLKVREEK